MTTIEISERGTRIKLTNDRTYQEVVIYARDEDQLDELVLKLTTELLKGGE
jgi:hypothetical protein